MPKPVLIDTDTGVDDALALILALRSPELSVKAITTVAGNVEVQKCTRNVLFLLNLLQAKDIAVVQGAAKPLERKLFTAPEVHGRNGLGNIPVRHSTIKARSTAVEEIIAFCKRYGRRGTIVALGPLTNIAKAIKKSPASLRKIGALISMGGAFRVPGNTGPVAEFNYYVDPEAAQLVLNSGLPITVVPLDVTEQVVMLRSEFKRRARRADNISQTILRFTDFYMRYHQQTERFYGGYAHDPMAVALAIDASIARTRPVRIDVGTSDDFERGMTSVSLEKRPVKNPSRVNLALKIDKKKFLKLFYQRLWK